MRLLKSCAIPLPLAKHAYTFQLVHSQRLLLAALRVGYIDAGSDVAGKNPIRCKARNTVANQQSKVWLPCASTGVQKVDKSSDPALAGKYVSAAKTILFVEDEVCGG